MKTLIRTYSDDIYIIQDKSPDEVRAEIEIAGVEWVRIPNGDNIRRASIAGIVSYESYEFQAEQKSRHQKGQFIKGGEWWDTVGPLHINAHLESITGELLQLSPPK